ncbi:glycoside hydrolase family 88 protein [Bowmanella sp. Y26]|uniref:glycoside hydrolase family 88/105 protein n=1 Tax=Bowmanella yangjiangensis TaxID=2811230 RepID=UPI001BDC0FE7|nr:glycoside hydrolase family 88 protein [Bowmanella yangjiangensis]MBT1063374.1 glycoside hydrolase family 88 protein [Bowmanella yangjiangensis]
MQRTTMKKLSLLGAAMLLLSGNLQAQSIQKLSSDMDKQDVYEAMRHVADWQWQQYDAEKNEFTGYEEGAHMDPSSGDSHPQGWVYAALHVGMTRWAELADNQGDASYYQKLAYVAKRNQYLFAPRIYNADDYAIGQLYLDLYEQYGDEKMITPLKVIFDQILLNPPTVGLTFDWVETRSTNTGKKVNDWFGTRGFHHTPCKNRWCWADALFMGPPVWIHLARITGDKRYLDFADQEFWATVDLLWDKDDHLFFRDSRFFDKREKNGEKVIWARGVGWVAAGLARILEQLPADHASRDKYEDIFRKMMTRLADAQQSDGFWRPSVLAPESQPYQESSGTALLAYAYASGIRHGVLDKKTFTPVLKKSWKALVGAVQSDGKLGWVQQIAAKPDSVDAEDTQMYAVGAFLLTGSELYQLLDKEMIK